MACRGALFAIDDDVAATLLTAPSDEDVMEVIEGIEEAWDEEWLVETDKSWDAMHRALGDGTLTPGSAPTSRAILGGRHLHRGDDYIVAFVNKDEVREVAHALASIDEAAMRQRYDQLVPKDYAADWGDDDREYTVECFRGVAELYAKAAHAGRAMIFTVDQ